MGGTKLDTSEFWVIGDFVAQVFAKWGGDGHRCYIDSSDPSEAERFDSYREARESCFNDEDIVDWKKEQRDPKAVKPLRCRVQVAVYPPGTRP